MRARREWVLVLSLVCRAVLAAEPPPPATPPPPVTVIKAGVLIDGVSGPKTNQVIVIRGNRIESVGGSSVPAGAKVIDLSGATVLPGLIDAHTHVFLQGEDPAEGGYDVQLLKQSPEYRTILGTSWCRRARS